MRVLFDTNIIIDYIGHREPFYHKARKILRMLPAEQLTGIISAGSITDIYYIVRKHYHDASAALDSIIDILHILTPVDTKVADIHAAIDLGFPDFEDAVICATAMREKAEYIITRNIDDFSASPIPAVTPEQFFALPGGPQGD